MRLAVRMVSASHTIEVEAKGSDTVGDIKRRIERQEGIPLDCQQLIFAGKKLEDQHTADDYNLERLSRPLYLVTQEMPPGGGRGPEHGRALPTQRQLPPRAALRPQGPVLLGPWPPQQGHVGFKQAAAQVVEEAADAPSPDCRLFEASFPELYRLSRRLSSQLGLDWR